MASPSYNLNYLNTLNPRIIAQDYKFYEIADKYGRVISSFNSDSCEELKESLNDELSNITGGDVIVKLWKDKKIAETKKLCIPFSLTQTHHISAPNNNDVLLQFELFKKQVQHDAEQKKIRDEYEEKISGIEEEHPLDKWLGHPLIQPTVQKHGPEIIAGIFDKVISMFIVKPQLNQPAQINGHTSEDRIKSILGSYQYNMLMSTLADMLEKDEKSTMEKITKIFS